MESVYCPVCGCSNCTIEDTANFYRLFRCKEGRHTYAIQNDVFNLAKEIQNKIFNLVFEILIQNAKYNNEFWYFSYAPTQQCQNSDKPQYVNVANLIQAYPSTIAERTNRSLINLSRLYPQYGMMIGLDTRESRAVFGEDWEENESSEAIVLRTKRRKYQGVLNRKTQTQKLV